MTSRVRSRLPGWFVSAARRVRRIVFLARVAVREWPRWLAIARAKRTREGPRVSYGRDRMPGLDEVVIGGGVKFQLLARELPNRPRDFNVLYLGSSALPVDARMLVRLARARRAAFVWNQNGVAYPGWIGAGYRRANQIPARLLREADYAIYQSAFCKTSADRFLGEREGPWEILHNPVDVERFTPAETRPARPLTLLLGGSQYQRYRFEAAVRTLVELPEVRLVVSGRLSWSPGAEAEGRALVADLGLRSRIEFTGAYSQAGAPDVIRRGDLLLHTKYNDPCPSVVLEAMACGLPVVYSASGGVPELVGEEAGVGVPAPLDWEVDHPPAPGELAEAVRRVAERLDDFAAAARERAERFDSRRWTTRHRELFEQLVR